MILKLKRMPFASHGKYAGSLMKIGMGQREPEWMLECFRQSRRVAAETAAADGLYLMRVVYPEYIFPAEDNFSCYSPR